MHHLFSCLRRETYSRFLNQCQVLVRFFALRRIKPHTPPLVRAPVNSFEFQPCGRTPQAGTYCVNSGTEGVDTSTPSIHRLRLGLPGYLIPFATLAFEPQRQLSRKPPSPLVFFPISTHFTATLGIPLSSPALKKPVRTPHGVEPRTFKIRLVPACAPFTPNNSGQRLPPTYYRGCWHVVSRGFLVRYRQIKTV